MSVLDSVDHTHRLYVLRHGDHYSHLGFDVCREWAESVNRWLECSGAPTGETVSADNVGTHEAYAQYDRIMTAGAEFCRVNGVRCPVRLTDELIGLEGARVEVVDRWDDKRRFYVGRSTGWLPIHLEVKRRDSSGGDGVSGAPFKSVRVIRKGARINADV